MRTIEHCPACDTGVGVTSGRQMSLPAIQGAAAMTATLSECRACSHVFMNPQPTAEELIPYYQEDYNVYRGTQADLPEMNAAIAEGRRTGRTTYAPVIPGERFLDVGCGLGNLVYVMSRLGMRAEGVELAEEAVRRAETLGVKVFHGTLEDARFPDEHFRVMTMLHVLEHVHDLHQTLAECRRVLRKDGELVIVVPNFDALLHALHGDDWYGLDLPRHIHHFRARSLERLVRRSGLTVRAIETRTKARFLESWLVDSLRRRLYVPARLTRPTRMLWPIAAVWTRLTDARGRGEELIIRLARA